MTLETCYQQLGGSYSEVHARIPSDALIKKFVAAFLKDTSFSISAARWTRPTARPLSVRRIP